MSSFVGWPGPWLDACLLCHLLAGVLVCTLPSPFPDQRACLPLPPRPSEKETEPRDTLREREERERQRERESNVGFWVEDSVAGTLASGKTAGLPIGSHVDDCPFDWLTGPGDSLLTLARLGCCASPWYACLHSPILESIPPPSTKCEKKGTKAKEYRQRERLERERERVR